MPAIETIAPEAPLGVQADARFASLKPELREALTVGRPIETAARL